MSSVVHIDLFKRRWFLRAPWNQPLFSERYAPEAHRVHLSLRGWRITSRPRNHGNVA